MEASARAEPGSDAAAHPGDSGRCDGPFHRKEHLQHAELVEHVRRLYKTAYPD
jgi:hypothetical protein